MTGAGSRTRIRGDPLRCVRLLGKDTEPEELVRAVRAVVGGDALLSPGVTRGLVAEFAARSKEPAAADALSAPTDRKREVMALVGTGLSPEEIARRLVVSPLTAKTHVSRTMVEPGAPRPCPTGRAGLWVGVGAARTAGLNPDDVLRGRAAPGRWGRRRSTRTTWTQNSTPPRAPLTASHGPRHEAGTGPHRTALPSTPKPAAPTKAPPTRANMISTVTASRSACVRLGDMPTVFQGPSHSGPFPGERALAACRLGLPLPHVPIKPVCHRAAIRRLCAYAPRAH